MPSDTVVNLVTNGKTLIQTVADNPHEQISKLAQKLYAHEQLGGSKFTKNELGKAKKRQDYSQEDLDRAAKCGKFPYRPSDLFLMIYCDALDTLESDPWVGMVSPPLLGSSGIILLSIISVIPDIMRHYKNLIANAETEVMIGTNYWEASYASSLVHDALKELSKRHEGKLKKPVVKLIYDRGNLKQVFKNHQRVPPDLWESVGLPSKEEIPNIDFEVMNFHRPIMGTFHSKYIVVDRKIACLNSNNIQDRVNVEMMTHIEGPIVDSFYDMALLTWSEALEPPLPLLSHVPNGDDEEYNQHLEDIYSTKRARTDGLSYDSHRSDSAIKTLPAEHRSTKPRGEVSALHREDMTTPAPEHLPSDVDHPSNKLDSSDPDPIAKQHLPSSEGTVAVEVRNIDSELATAIQKYGAARAVANHLNAGMQHTDPTCTDDAAEGFSSHVLHGPHKPFPIAMVNRPPHGTPGHGDLNVPQNVAWLAGFRLAQKSIFIQTPTFNAEPVVEEILNACRRGVECTLYLDLGFNDGGEMLPGQGGTNSRVVANMYKVLNAEQKQEYLAVYWYTAKDQNKPLDAAEKRRNCHVKFCIIDDQVAIQGNGNQDTQSWFHSQEINIMVDSPEMCSEWRAGLDANQNTAHYGRISNVDGLWRDNDGNAIDSKLGQGGPKQFVKGLAGAVARVQGKGGF